MVVFCGQIQYSTNTVLLWVCVALIIVSPSGAQFNTFQQRREEKMSHCLNFSSKEDFVGAVFFVAVTVINFTLMINNCKSLLETKCIEEEQKDKKSEGERSFEEKKHKRKREERGGGSKEGETKQLYDFIPLWEPLNLQRRSEDNNYYLNNSMNFNQFKMSVSAVFLSFIAKHLRCNLKCLTREDF